MAENCEIIKQKWELKSWRKIVLGIRSNAIQFHISVFSDGTRFSVFLFTDFDFVVAILDWQKDGRNEINSISKHQFAIWNQSAINFLHFCPENAQLNSLCSFSLLCLFVYFDCRLLHTRKKMNSINATHFYNMKSCELRCCLAVLLLLTA